MSIGIWNKTLQAIEFRVDAAATRIPIIVAMFSASWYMRFDILRLEDAAAGPKEHLLASMDNCDPARLRFTFRPEPGAAYRIRPRFRQSPCDGTIPDATDIDPQITVGNDPAGTTRTELFEWNFGIAGGGKSGTGEQAAITLILVDNNVGLEDAGRTVDS